MAASHKLFIIHLEQRVRRGEKLGVEDDLKKMKKTQVRHWILERKNGKKMGATAKGRVSPVFVLMNFDTNLCSRLTMQVQELSVTEIE